MLTYIAADYPYKPPTVKFETPCFHPNVDTYGNICLDILKEKWSAAYSVHSVLVSLQSLLGTSSPAPQLLSYTSLSVAAMHVRACSHAASSNCAVLQCSSRSQLTGHSISWMLSRVGLAGEPNNDSPLNVNAAKLWDNQTEYRATLLRKSAEQGSG